MAAAADLGQPAAPVLAVLGSSATLVVLFALAEPIVHVALVIQVSYS